jgi:hypothetical protein
MGRPVGDRMRRWLAAAPGALAKPVIVENQVLVDPLDSVVGFVEQVAIAQALMAAGARFL